MNLGLAFAPLISPALLWAATAVATLLGALVFATRSRGAVIRTIALALIVLALANPSLTREDRDPLSSVAVVVVDKSPSQGFGDRTKQTDAARAAVVDQLNHIPGLDVRVVEAGQADGETDGTRLFGALGSTLADVPSMPRSLAGNSDFFTRYGLDGKVSLIGLDYGHRTANVYFGNLPDGFLEPKAVKTMLRELELRQPRQVHVLQRIQRLPGGHSKAQRGR